MLTNGYQRLIPIILATQEAEISRIMVQNQPGQIVHKNLWQKIPNQKNKRLEEKKGGGQQM
jgi:hypothetical protein